MSRSTSERLPKEWRGRRQRRRIREALSASGRRHVTEVIPERVPLWGSAVLQEIMRANRAEADVIQTAEQNGLPVDRLLHEVSQASFAQLWPPSRPATPAGRLEIVDREPSEERLPHDRLLARLSDQRARLGADLDRIEQEIRLKEEGIEAAERSAAHAREQIDATAKPLATQARALTAHRLGLLGCIALGLAAELGTIFYIIADLFGVNVARVLPSTNLALAVTVTAAWFMLMIAIAEEVIRK